MIICKCIERLRNKQGRIYGYRLVDISGNIQEVTPENLKIAIRNKQVNVVNLGLTSDNRLIYYNEEKLKNEKILGKSPDSIRLNDSNNLKLFKYVAENTGFELDRDTYGEYNSTDTEKCYTIKTKCKQYNICDIKLYLHYSSNGLSICIEGENNLDFELEYVVQSNKLDDGCKYVNDFLNLIDKASKMPAASLKLACVIAENSAELFEKYIEEVLDILTNKYNNKNEVEQHIQSNINNILKDKSNITRIHNVIKNTASGDYSKYALDTYTKYAVLYEALTNEEFTDVTIIELLDFDIDKFSF